MTAFVLVAAQAYGDNVISLGLLKGLKGRVDLKILGTRLTREIADIIGFDAFPIITLPTDNLAFYDLKVAGPRRAFSDLLLLGRTLRPLLAPGTVVLFENHRRRWPALALQLAGRFSYRLPLRRQSAYEDRRTMFAEALGCPIAAPGDALPPGRTRRVLIAPTAREEFRDIPPPVIIHLLQYFANRGIHACLLDPANRHQDLRERAASFIESKPLMDGVRALRGCDLVITPDSLFCHLSYHFGIPVIAVVPDHIARDFYFAPPGLSARGLLVSFTRARQHDVLGRFLDEHLIPG
jgi:hypothetical protein